MYLSQALQMTQEAKSYSTDGSINLECVYSGKSQGSLKWFHKSDEILTGGNAVISQSEFKNNEQKFTLNMKDVSVELNAGKYTCLWSDDWSDNDGDRIVAETDVVVRTGVIVSDLRNDGQPYKYVEGDIVELQCQFEGDLEPKAVVWQNDGSDINFDGVTNIIVNKRTDPDPDYGVQYTSSITINGPASDEEYTCKFSFDDENQVTSTVKVVTIQVVTQGPFIFFDYKDGTLTSIDCTLQGNLESVGATVKEASMTYNGQSVYNQAGKTEIKYPISDVSNGDDGTYKCDFVLDDEEQFSETIYLVARSKFVYHSHFNANVFFFTTFR